MGEIFCIIFLTFRGKSQSKISHAMRISHCVVHRLVTTAIIIAASCSCVAAQETSKPYQYNHEPFFTSCPGIVIPPRSVNISLNEVAEINCKAIATFINWEVNGQPFDDTTRSKGFDDSALIVILNVTQNLRISTLRVVGSPDSNGANITCIAIQLIPMISGAASEPALILVQGDIL